MPKRKWAPEEMEKAKTDSDIRYQRHFEWRRTTKVGNTLSSGELLALPLPEIGLWPEGTMFRDNDGQVWEWVPEDA